MGDLQTPPPTYEAVTRSPIRIPYFLKSRQTNKKGAPVIGWNPNLINSQTSRQSNDTVVINATAPMLEQQPTGEEHVSRTAIQQHIAANSKIYFWITIGFVGLVLLIVLIVIIVLSSRSSASDNPERWLPKVNKQTTISPEWNW